jgi:hypothetical protein
MGNCFVNPDWMLEKVRLDLEPLAGVSDAGRTSEILKG